MYFGCAGPHCCLGFSLVSRRCGHLLVAVHGLLIAVVSLGVEHGLWGMWASVVATHGLNTFCSWALEHRVNSCGSQA